MNNNEIEEWRPIQGYECYYQVSSLGRIRSLDRYVSRNGEKVLRKGRILKSKKTNAGYLEVQLYKDGKQKTLKVHRLVASAFPEICGQFRKELDVDHKNTVRTDNRAINLHWVTRSENNLNPITRQRISDAKKGEKCYFYGKHGKLHPMFGKFGKLNPNSKPITQYDRQGNFLAEFSCARDAERQLGIRCTSICEALKGKRKTAGGYIWKYKTA